MKNEQSLSEIQNEILKAIRENTLPESLLHLIQEKPPISIKKRMEIYQDGYEVRITQSLQDDFSLVEEHMGERDFKKLINEYLRTYPSRVYNLIDYSEDFKNYLQTKSEDLFNLAEKDWLMMLSSLARELTTDELVSVEEVQKGTPFLLKKNLSTFSKRIQDDFFVTFRFLSEVKIKKISKAEYLFLEALSNGKSLEDLFLQMKSLGFESENTLGQTVQNFLTKEIIYCERI